MSSSEVVGAGVLAFSFTLHFCFIGITGCMSLKCSSLSFLVASSLIFCALICWILFLWLDVRPRGHQRGAGAISGAVVLEGFFYPEAKETGLSYLAATMNWFQLLSWSLPLPLEPYSALLPPPLEFSLCRDLLCYRSKTHSSALSSLNYSLVDKQRVHPLVYLARAGDQELSLLPLKPNGLVWHSRLFGFLVLGLHRLLRKILHSQNLQQVLTIPGGRASVAEPTVHTTLPMVDKAGTSSAEVPMAQTLVARPGSKVPHGNLVVDDPGLLNFTMAEFEIICRMSSRL
jgi:hypothetical protein